MLAFLPPVLFLALGWFLNDPVALLASAVFSFFALLVAVIQGRANWLRGWGHALLGGLVLVYLVSSLVNGVSWAAAFPGIYQRNFGLFFWIALALVFCLSASGALKSELFTGISLPILLGLASIYGLLQYFDKDPFPWRDPFDAVQLTLGNPNFSGAMLGIISVIPLAWVIGNVGAGWRVLGVLTFVVVLVLAKGSKSLQALVVMVIVVAAFILVKVSRTSGLFARVFKYLGAVVGALVVVGMPVLVFTNVGFLSGLRERFFFQGSITQRLDYWRTGFEIFRDHPWFGVGPDQFQRYAALYRTKDQIVRDGAFVIPDKAHSVLIDALANGGIFAGLLWSAFVILIFIRLVQTARMDLPVKVREQLAVLGAIWCGYVFQALISPDQLLLAVLGFMSAGLIVNLHKSQVKVPVKRSKFEFLFEDAIYARTFLLSIFAIAVVIWSQAISADMAAKKVLNNENLTRDSVLAAVNQWPAPKTTELIAIAVSQADSQCDLADELADRLIEIDDRSAQGWYLKAICFNVNREFDEALSASENALKFDPINPTYLVAKAKLGIAAGNKGAASEALAVIKSNYPDNPEISPLDSSISLMP